VIAAEDLRGVAIITGAFLAVLLLAEIWSRFLGGKPEATRKLVHLGGGLLGLFLPFLIRSTLVVFLLTLSLSTLFAVGGKTGLLKSIHGVKRSTRGSEYYPLAIFLVFLISADRPWLYVSAVLVLAVADAFAALIGSRYGVIRYEVEDEFKSLEGSLVFLIIAFLAVHLPALLMTDLPRGVVVMSALLVALLVTGFEAISLRGTDNIFVPIAVVFVLQKITTKALPEIVYQTVSLLGILLVIALIAWRFRTFNVGGTIAVVLFIFATWSLGSRRWSLPIFLGIAAFVLMRLALRFREAEPLRVRVITHALLVPFLILLAANLTSRYNFFFAPYVLAAVMILTLIWWDGRQRRQLLVQWNDYAVATMLGASAVVVIALPIWLLFNGDSMTLAFLALIAIVLAAANVIAVRMQLASESSERGWSGVSFIIALVAAAAMVMLQETGVVAGF
jgi:phytol kinase